MKFNTPEEAVAFAMSIEPKPMKFRSRGWHKNFATIGKYGRFPSYCKVTDPLWGKYFIDIQTPFGSDNGGSPEFFNTYEEARAYLENIGFEPIK